jgi:PIN domain nuclease of toxin-antitoxin system
VNLLLDTCTFVWLLADSPDLSSRVRQCFSDPGNEVYLSVVSTWEIVIKYRLGRLPLPEPPQRFIPTQRELHDIRPLPLEEAAVLQLARLPDYHKDPFDRMLICQAIAHGLTILTPDPAITQYPVRTEW